jgi:hypothetical protein
VEALQRELARCLEAARNSKLTHISEAEKETVGARAARPVTFWAEKQTNEGRTRREREREGQFCFVDGRSFIASKWRRRKPPFPLEAQTPRQSKQANSSVAGRSVLACCLVTARIFLNSRSMLRRSGCLCPLLPSRWRRKRQPREKRPWPLRGPGTPRSDRLAVYPLGCYESCMRNILSPLLLCPS